MKLPDWNSELIDKHRRGISDIDWAGQQPTGKPQYAIGDVVEFKAGGYGVIHAVNKPHDGWPSTYATEPIEGMKDHPSGKRAWHHEFDFRRRIAKSPLHRLTSKGKAIR